MLTTHHPQSPLLTKVIVASVILMQYQHYSIGYNILVEKPMAVTEEDCIRMTRAAMDNNIIMAVGHVMRY